MIETGSEKKTDLRLQECKILRYTDRYRGQGKEVKDFPEVSAFMTGWLVESHKEGEQRMRTRSLRSRPLRLSWTWELFEMPTWPCCLCRPGPERRGPSLRSRSA